jgi:GNAT superfamily N-acetyltransferase
MTLSDHAQSRVGDKRFRSGRGGPICDRGRRISKARMSIRGMKEMLDVSADEAAGAEVLVADPAKLQRVLGAVTLAFAADPPSRWLFPEADAYMRHFPTFIRGLGGPAVEQGTAFVAPDYGAVSLWLAPGVPSNEALLGQLIEEQVAPEKQADFAAVIEQMGIHHPQEPHWYLPFIAVEPLWQGRGRGGVLLRYALSVCDAAGLPAYLESTSPRSQPLYERHGFEAVGEIRVGQCPPIVPMVRRARG